MISGKEVLERVFEHLGLTPAAFANKIGLARPQAIRPLYLQGLNTTFYN